MKSATVRVYEVLYDTESEGPAGDGTVIARFRKEREAETFARGETCYGRPAKASPVDAPRRLAQRWGMA
jgi:hypothetical protein